MITADSEGTPMWVQIKNTMIKRFQHLLTTGSVYLMKNFSVSPVSGQYRPVDSKFKLVFTLLTTVKRTAVPVTSIPMHVFQFVTHATIFQRADNPTYLTDMIGRLLTFGEIEAVSGGHVKRDLEVLTDICGTVRITLWSNLAESFVIDHELANGAAPVMANGSAPVMLIVTSLKIKQYSAAYTFSATGATQCFIDLDHCEVPRLRADLGSDPAPVIFLGRSPGVVGITTKAMSENRMDIATILDAPWVNEKPGYKMTFTGRVSEILTQYGWYYIGCTGCKGKANLEDGSYKCTKCLIVSSTPTVLFKIHFVVQDGTDMITCTSMNKVSGTFLLHCLCTAKLLMLQNCGMHILKLCLKT